MSHDKNTTARDGEDGPRGSPQPASSGYASAISRAGSPDSDEKPLVDDLLGADPAVRLVLNGGEQQSGERPASFTLAGSSSSTDEGRGTQSSSGEE